MTDPDVPILDVLEDAIDCILFGSGGAFAIPAGGYCNVTWLTKKKCYRGTVDLVVHPPSRRQTPEGIGARRVVRHD